MSNELVSHKSWFKLTGIVSGMSSDKFFKEGVSKKNDRAWKRINFAVNTSPENKVWIELMGNVMDKAYAYNRNLKKSKAIDWDNRNGKMPNGYQLIEPDWDKIDKIKNEISDGDTVNIIGEIQYSEYEDKPQYKCSIKNVYKSSKELDFESEDFEEENKFTQELTIIDTEVDKETNKMLITAYIIQNRGKNNPPDVQNAVFTVDIEKNKKFAKTVHNFKFGDTLKVQGTIKNKIVTEIIEQDDSWGSVDNVIETFEKELEVLGAFADTYEKKKYKEEDFAEVLLAKEAQEEIGEDNVWGNTDNESEENEVKDEDVLPWE